MAARGHSLLLRNRGNLQHRGATVLAVASRPQSSGSVDNSPPTTGVLSTSSFVVPIGQEYSSSEPHRQIISTPRKSLIGCQSLDEVECKQCIPSVFQSKAVDADSSGIIDDGVVARIRDIVGIGAQIIIPRVGPDNSEAGFDSPSHLYLVKDECKNNSSHGIRTYVQLNHFLPI